MTKRLKKFSVVISLLLLQLCGFAEAPSYDRKWRNISELDLRPGDMVACILPQWWAKVFQVPHWLMAINRRELIHVINPYKTCYVGKVSVVPKEPEFNPGYNTQRCINFGHGDHDGQIAVQRAVAWHGHIVYYHGLFCSCQHWVNYWLTGHPGGSLTKFPLLMVKKPCKLHGLGADYTPIDPMRVEVKYKQMCGVAHWAGERVLSDEEFDHAVRKVLEAKSPQLSTLPLLGRQVGGRKSFSF